MGTSRVAPAKEKTMTDHEINEYVLDALLRTYWLWQLERIGLRPLRRKGKRK
jgi:hypothetical protein